MLKFVLLPDTQRATFTAPLGSVDKSKTNVMDKLRKIKHFVKTFKNYAK